MIVGEDVIGAKGTIAIGGGGGGGGSAVRFGS